ncbi:MAG TPA: L,D-transpeptidase family protein [Chitinophagales bacterium]|nr:L,D-transpeptidase family protein [Chitinophagales bacterium]HNE45412.1 L,D-transpeptidase family protein [Chitinophagales bacterium]
MKIFPKLLVLTAMLATIGWLSSCRHEAGAEEEGTDLEDLSQLKPVFYPLHIDSQSIAVFLQQYPLFDFHREEVFAFYKQRNDQSAWFNEYGIVDQGGYFMNLLDHFSEEGLRDSVIYYSTLNRMYHTISDPAYSYNGADSLTTQFELMLTSTFFVYAQKVWYGLSEKTTRSLDWYVTRKTVPSVSILDSILSGNASAFTAYEPLFPQYSLLKNALKKYHAIENEPWDSIAIPADRKSILLGDDLPVLSEIKRRLFLLGDLNTSDSTTLYDSTTLAAVMMFQERHGLFADGSMGPKFFTAINRTPAELIRRIEINMERCRWIPDQPGGDYILVNIPEYTMHIYEADTQAWEMNVVVGKSSTSTTIFNDELEYIVFSPYWVPPPSILNNEILPSLKKDPNYLQKQNMEAFNPSTREVINVSKVDWSKYTSMPYSIRQKPGNSNALGWVKFLFPNEHNIYFHDTPSRDLFVRESRGFSHGCIRLQEPKKLAQYLLRNDSTYTEQVIDSLYYLGRENYVKLENKIPVYIIYLTAWVDDNGLVQFRKDIYGHDAKLEQTMYGAPEVDLAN